MEKKNEIQKAEQPKALERSFAQQLEEAKFYVKSGFLPKAIDTPEKALMVMQTGKDLGLKPTEALRSISIIQGVPCMKAQLLLGLCYKTGQVEDCKIEESKDACKVTLKRKRQSPYTVTFTIEDAKKMGLAGRDNWIKQPQTMLRWRALSAACRIVFPDAISGLYTEEEIADNVIVGLVDGKPEVVEVNTEAPKLAEPPQDPSDVRVEQEQIPDDQLGNWVMPLGKYKGFTLVSILGDVSAEGKLRGLDYLNWLAENAQNQEYRDLIVRFLAFAEKEGLLPGADSSGR